METPKDLVVDLNMYYPAVFGFWSKNKETSQIIQLKKDEVLLQKIKEYIIRSKQMMHDIDTRIAQLISP